MSELGEKLGNMEWMAYKVCTVADLVNSLSGLPPMMEVFVDADGVSMFLNESSIGTHERPFLRLICSRVPRLAQYGQGMDEPRSEDSYEERLARQSQRAMHMSHIMEQESRMPPMD